MRTKLEKKIDDHLDEILKNYENISKKIDLLIEQRRIMRLRDEYQDKQIRAIQQHLGLAPVAS